MGRRRQALPRRHHQLGQRRLSRGAIYKGQLSLHCKYVSCRPCPTQPRLPALRPGPPPSTAPAAGTWHEQRSWGLDFPLEALADHPLASDIAAAWKELYPSAPTPSGYTPVSDPSAAITVGDLTVAFDKGTGALNRLDDAKSKVSWLDSQHMLGAFHYKVGPCTWGQGNAAAVRRAADSALTAWPLLLFFSPRFTAPASTTPSSTTMRSGSTGRSPTTFQRCVRSWPFNWHWRGSGVTAARCPCLAGLWQTGAVQQLAHCQEHFGHRRAESNVHGMSAPCRRSLRCASALLALRRRSLRCASALLALKRRGASLIDAENAGRRSCERARQAGACQHDPHQHLRRASCRLDAVRHFWRKRHVSRTKGMLPSGHGMEKGRSAPSALLRW